MTDRRKLGSVYQDGAFWVASVSLPGPDGARRRVKRKAKDQAGAEQALADLLHQAGRGVLLPPEAITTGDWIDQHLRRRLADARATTEADARWLADKVKGSVGHVRLQHLAPHHVQAAVDGLLEHKHRTRLRALQLLRSALDEAVGLGLIPRNPALAVKLARQPREVAGHAWGEDEAAQFLDRSQHDDLFALFALGLGLGLRIGELLALRPSDLSLARQRLRVERTVSGQGAAATVGPPKTPASVRTLPLPDPLVPILAQAAARAGRGPFLFPGAAGAPLGYFHVRHHFRAAVKRAAVTPIRLHDLRYTFTSLALRRGVPPEVVSRILGHTNVAFTLRQYRLLVPGEMEEAAPLLGLILPQN